MENLTKIKFVLLIFCIAIISCSNNDNDHILIDSLIGKWEEVSPCESCSTVTFESNNIILLKYNSDQETYKMTYTIENNSMLVTRLWDVGEQKKSNIVTINFKSKDTLQLSQFSATDASSTTGFNDIVLKKI